MALITEDGTGKPDAESYASVAMAEVWRPAVGFEGYYEVSSMGRVRSIDRIVRGKFGGDHLQPGRVLKQAVKVHGYHFVNLSCDGRARCQHVHRLVAKAFLTADDARPEVNHKSGVKSDNSASNLEWVTKSENSKHAYRTGLRERKGPTPKFGMDNPGARHSTEVVLAIVAARANGETFKQISERLGVSQAQACRIANGKRRAAEVSNVARG